MSQKVAAASFETCLDALGNVERRRLLLALLEDTSEGDRTVALDRSGAGATDERWEQSMYHLHLPKLEGAGFIDATWERRSVTAGPRFGEIRPLLELLDNNRSKLPDGWI